MRSQRSVGGRPPFDARIANGVSHVVRQRLAGAAPQRLRIGDPLRVGGAGGLARVQLRATQGRRRDRRRPRGAERRPVLAARGFRQPQFAERLGDGLTVVGLQEFRRLRRGHGGDLVPQLRVLDPAMERMARMADQPRVGAPVELAALGRRQRAADGGVGIGRGRRESERGGACAASSSGNSASAPSRAGRKRRNDMGRTIADEK